MFRDTKVKNGRFAVLTETSGISESIKFDTNLVIPAPGVNTMESEHDQEIQQPSWSLQH